MDEQPVDQPKNLLVTLTGKDRPGVTSAMFSVFAAAGVSMPDDRQVPAWITQWREDSSLPSARRPAPHSWVG